MVSTFGWFSAATACASAVNRRRRSGSAATDACRFLMATQRLSRGSGGADTPPTGEPVDPVRTVTVTWLQRHGRIISVPRAEGKEKRSADDRQGHSALKG